VRQVVLDTETTGLAADQGHRIIEIGCLEIVERRLTGRSLHVYLNPERPVDEAATEVHGMTWDDLRDKPRFAEVADRVLEFVDGAEVLIHNAAFDVGFLNAEIRRLKGEHPPIDNLCRVLDTLALAREIHPGQRNSLDALCKRYGVDNSRRALHGALIDARILADVYLAMTGGQSALELGESRPRRGANGALPAPVVRNARPEGALRVVEPSAAELAAHEDFLARIAKAAGGRCLFKDPPTA
jgi:DNA polymerase-3 subunit epsilon